MPFAWVGFSPGTISPSQKHTGLTLKEIARQEDVVSSYVTRLLRLSYLAPDIIDHVVNIGKSWRWGQSGANSSPPARGEFPCFQGIYRENSNKSTHPGRNQPDKTRNLNSLEAISLRDGTGNKLRITGMTLSISGNELEQNREICGSREM